MLDHTKPYVEKMHNIDAELAGHVHKRDMKLQRLCESDFYSVCCAHAYQAIPLWSELTNNTAKTKMGYISLPSNLNAVQE